MSLLSGSIARTTGPTHDREGPATGPGAASTKLMIVKGACLCGARRLPDERINLFYTTRLHGDPMSPYTLSLGEGALECGRRVVATRLRIVMCQVGLPA